MVNPDPIFTVFTSTFNRAHTLYRPFRSLAGQTFRSFEWLVVDDGSTDGTRDLIDDWSTESRFPIRYLWQENQGLHIAFNRAVREAKGEFFFPLDSDDAIVPEALERLHWHWERIPEHRRREFSGVCCLCRGDDGRLIGDRFPEDVMDSDSLEMAYRYRVRGQKGGFHRTDVMRQFPFDETQAMGANPWRRIARNYKMRFVNEILEIYYQDDPAGSLSRGRRVNRPMTSMYRHGEILNFEIDWFWQWPQAFLRSAANYVRFSLHCGSGLAEQFKGLTNVRGRLLVLMAYLAGYLVYRQDVARGRVAARRIMA